MTKARGEQDATGGDAPSTSDPIEIAMEAESHDRAPDSPARQLLIKQGRLLDLQIRRERLLVWTQGLVVLVVAVAVLVIGAVVWRASQDRSIVVQAFSAPESLADRGMTGDAAAMRLLDNLSTIRGAISASTFLATNKIQGGGDNLKIEIPQAGGLTIDDLNKLLIRWFGRQTIISGQILDEGEERVTVIVRSSRHGVSRVTGRMDDLDGLFLQLAEAVFAKAEPTNWVQYLERSGRYDESYAMAQRLARQPGLSDLPPAYNVGLLGDQEPDPRRSLALIALSLRDEPNFMASWIVGARRRTILGHDEMALYDSRKVLSLRERDQNPRFRGVGVARMRAEAQFNERFLLGDFRPAPDQYPSHRATLLALAHETAGARAILSEAAVVGGMDPDFAQMVQARIALARDDGEAALRSLDQVRATRIAFSATPETPGAARRDSIPRIRNAEDLARRTNETPLRVRALIATGRAQEAQALAADTPDDCHVCVLARGEAAAAMGDWKAADRWFDRAAALAPSLPWSHLARGRSRLAHGALADAEAALSKAQDLAPRLAEVRYEQGVLASRRGDQGAAVRAFRAAAHRAPGWGRLHIVWGELEARRGRPTTARELWNKAAGMDLSPADRARLNTLLAKA